MLSHLMIALIRAYQVVLGPHLGPFCRFAPSCSTYWIEALGRHGVWHGTRLGLRRLWRCRPFGPLGADPVPQSIKRKRKQA